MAATRHIRVFVSSPGDVPDERALAARVIEDIPHNPLFKGRVTTEVVAWDQPGASTPLLATMTPQEAINQGMPLPAECDIVIIILWSRIGTPLPPEYRKPNTGERYRSGTEWEYLNAVNEAGVSAKRGDDPSLPQVIIYRRTQEPVIGLRDPDRHKKMEQWEAVETFFAEFTNADGSIQRGFNAYTTPDIFRQQLEQHIKLVVQRLLESPAIDRKIEPKAKPTLWQGSPFPGLRAFTPDDAPIFYGRDIESDPLIDMLRTNRIVAVVAASGSGKSSLIGAGLLPRLKTNAIEGSKDWVLPHMDGAPGQRYWTGLRFTPGELVD